MLAVFAVYKFRKPITASLPSAKPRPLAEDEEQFNSLRTAKSFESRHSGFPAQTGGYRYSRVGTSLDHEEQALSDSGRPRSFSHPAITEQLYDPPTGSSSSHTGDHEETCPALPPHSFTYPPVTASPKSASSSFYRYDPFNPPEPDELSSGSHPPPISSPYSAGKPLRELSFPPPRKTLSPFTYEPYSPSSPRAHLLSPTSPHRAGHSRGRSGGNHG